MPFRRRRPTRIATAQPERSGVGPFLKRWTIPLDRRAHPHCADRGQHRGVHRQEPARVPHHDLHPRFRQRADAQLLGRPEHLSHAPAAPAGPPHRQRAQPGDRPGRGHGGDHHRRLPDCAVLLSRPLGLQPPAQRADVLHRGAVARRCRSCCGLPSIEACPRAGGTGRRRSLLLRDCLLDRCRRRRRRHRLATHCRGGKSAPPPLLGSGSPASVSGLAISGEGR